MPRKRIICKRYALKKRIICKRYALKKCIVCKRYALKKCIICKRYALKSASSAKNAKKVWSIYNKAVPLHTLLDGQAQNTLRMQTVKEMRRTASSVGRAQHF